MSAPHELFPDAVDLIRVTPEQMLEEVERELAMRRAVYRQWIADGKLTLATAKIRLARMTAARNVLHNFVIGPGLPEQTIEPEGLGDG